MTVNPFRSIEGTFKRFLEMQYCARVDVACVPKIQEFYNNKSNVSFIPLFQPFLSLMDTDNHHWKLVIPQRKFFWYWTGLNQTLFTMRANIYVSSPFKQHLKDVSGFVLMTLLVTFNQGCLVYEFLVFLHFSWFSLTTNDAHGTQPNSSEVVIS